MFPEPSPNLYQGLAKQRGDDLMDISLEDLIFLTENPSQPEDQFTLWSFPSGVLSNIPTTPRGGEEWERVREKEGHWDVIFH